MISVSRINIGISYDASICVFFTRGGFAYDASHVSVFWFGETEESSNFVDGDRRHSFPSLYSHKKLVNS